MKAFAIALLLIAFCYPVSAADRFVGTYKLNPAKSATSGGQAGREHDRDQGDAERQGTDAFLHVHERTG